MITPNTSPLPAFTGATDADKTVYCLARSYPHGMAKAHIQKACNKDMTQVLARLKREGVIVSDGRTRNKLVNLQNYKVNHNGAEILMQMIEKGGIRRQVAPLLDDADAPSSTPNTSLSAAPPPAASLDKTDSHKSTFDTASTRITNPPVTTVQSNGLGVAQENDNEKKMKRLRSALRKAQQDLILISCSVNRIQEDLGKCGRELDV